MTNTAQILYEYLTATGTGLYTLCATRVYLNQLPKGFDNTQAGIVFSEQAERPTMSGSKHGMAYEFRCYGGGRSQIKPLTVFRALWDRLHGARSQATVTGTIDSAVLETASPYPDDPVTGWPAHFARFLVTFDEE